MTLELPVSVSDGALAAGALDWVGGWSVAVGGRLVGWMVVESVAGGVELLALFVATAGGEFDELLVVTADELEVAGEFVEIGASLQSPWPRSSRTDCPRVWRTDKVRLTAIDV